MWLNYVFLNTQYLYKSCYFMSCFYLRVMGNTFWVILMCHAVNHWPKDRFKCYSLFLFSLLLRFYGRFRPCLNSNNQEIFHNLLIRKVWFKFSNLLKIKYKLHIYKYLFTILKVFHFKKTHFIDVCMYNTLYQIDNQSLLCLFMCCAPQRSIKFVFIIIWKRTSSKNDTNEL